MRSTKQPEQLGCLCLMCVQADSRGFSRPRRYGAGSPIASRKSPPFTSRATQSARVVEHATDRLTCKPVNTQKINARGTHFRSAVTVRENTRTTHPKYRPIFECAKKHELPVKSVTFVIQWPANRKPGARFSNQPIILEVSFVIYVRPKIVSHFFSVV